MNKKRLTIKNNVKIINDINNSYVLKKKNNNIDNLYNYLKSRAFDYFPEKINTNEEYDVYEYINDVDEPEEQKALDLINLLTLLHNKTTFYKEVDVDKYKEIYEKTLNDIEYLFNYYSDILSIIEREIYMSPSSYLLARNISKLFASIDYCNIQLNEWYELVKDKRKIRYVNIHNNLSIDHYLKNNKSYFISWDKSRIDMPIYDLLNFYHNHYLDFDFSELFRTYEAKYPLTIEEKKLLFVLLVLPKKIDLNDSEENLCKKIRMFFDYLYKTEDLINEYEKVKS